MGARLLRILFRALCVPVFCLGINTAAHASFGDCNDPGYLSRFEASLGAGRFDCVERERFPVSSTSGERHIRIIHHLFADWLAEEADFRRFEDGIREAAQAIGTLGGVAFRDTTILLLDSSYGGPGAVTDVGEVAAVALGGSADECRIVVYLMSPAIEPVMAAHVVAHEIFHCVQMANLSGEQMSSGSMGTGSGGDWWLEGSAEWFAQYAVRRPDFEALARRVANFDTDSASRSLYEMDYGSVVFFLWLAQQGDGAREIIPFLRSMASSAGAPAQRQSMRASMPPTRWLKFAQDYMDGNIRDAQGRALRSTPVAGTLLEWEGSRARRLTVQAFQIIRAPLKFACGQWELSASPDQAHAQQEVAGAAWNSLPSQIEATGGGAQPRYVGLISSEQARHELQLQGWQRSVCGDCAGVTALDQCVVGTWSFAGSDLLDKLNVKMVRTGRFTSSMMATLRFAADGTYTISPVQMESSFSGVRGERGKGAMQGGATGRWSADAGKLNFCHDASTVAGQASVQVPGGGRVAVPIPPSSPGVQRHLYHCSDAELRSEMDVPGMGPVKSRYSRVAE